MVRGSLQVFGKRSYLDIMRYGKRQSTSFLKEELFGYNAVWLELVYKFLERGVIWI